MMPHAVVIVELRLILPRDNAWNERIDKQPLLTNSAAMISQIISDLASDRRTLRPFYEMNYVLVPDAQPAKPIQFVDYPDESDLDGGAPPNGLYPIPDNLPVETWPRGTGALTLQQWQQDVNGAGGDRPITGHETRALFPRSFSCRRLSARRGVQRGDRAYAWRAG
jgi:hypothetical protein